MLKLKTIFFAQRPNLKLWDYPLGCKIARYSTVTALNKTRRHSILPSSPNPAGTTSVPEDPQACQRRANTPADVPGQGEDSKLDIQSPLALFSHIVRVYTGHNIRNPFLLSQTDPSLAPYVHLPDQYASLISALAESQHLSRAVEALEFGFRLGLRHDPRTYEDLCLQLADRTEWELVIHVVDLCKENTQRCSTALLNRRAQALVELAMYRELEEMLEEFYYYDLKPNRLTFHYLLKGFIRNQDLPGAKQCLKQMIKAGFPMTPATHAIIVCSHRNLGIDDAVQEQGLKSLPYMGPAAQIAVLNSLLRYHLDNRDLHKALGILSLYDQQSVEMVPGILVGKDADHDKRPGAHFIPTAPVVLPSPPKPNASTFAVLIHFCSVKHDFSSSLQLLHYMMSQGIIPSPQVIAALITACFSGDRPDLAVQLVAGLCDSDTTPQHLFEPIYSGSWEGPRFEIHVPNMKPNIKIFNALMKGTLAVYGIEGGRHVLNIMQVNKVPPDNRTLELILGYLERVRDVRPERLIRLLQRSFNDRITPTPKLMRIVFRSILRIEKYRNRNLGWQWWYHKQGKRPLPSFLAPPQTDSIVEQGHLNFPTDHWYRHISKIFFKAIADRGYNADIATVGMAMRFEAVVRLDMNAARKLFEYLIARGMKPDAFHFSAMMEGFTLIDDMTSAHEVFDAAKDLGVVNDPVLYTVLIAGYARTGRPRKAEKVFKEMLDRGITPDVPSIDAFVGSWYAVGALGLAKRLLMSLWECVEPFPPSRFQDDLLALVKDFRTLHRKPGGRPLRALSREKSIALRDELTVLARDWRAATRTKR
ncbi:hypothetical protein CC1G_06797 [Coprinopsis cinerea okayama7|uniref:Pentatricopeptide repeat protein n=1 Tax=Coprinopsis cinerea (strain Okayama-7 / 130 / ATCC MYA-4618 / FGSC 9003) TaxID=240176 RepID=A8N1R9_COPC7|nr:hypothetical protein CC1G_06797 [Coprinopsis cinerea okayama7\|eukprot:XP_001828811.1 hypothetical protein CC1G_06797 [Coprinopsis cinerea okayama7\